MSKYSWFMLILSLPAYGQVSSNSARELFELQNPNWQQNRQPIVQVFRGSLHTPSVYQGMSANTDYDQIQFIGLERSGCYGTCPVYEVFIRSTGEVEYEGIAFVQNIGRYKSRLEPYKLENVFKYVMEIEYYNFGSNYTQSVTDNPTAYTMVGFINGSSKAIRNYANAGPAELWALEQLIDQVIDGVEWVEN